MTSLLALSASVTLLAILNGPLGIGAWQSSTITTASVTIGSYNLNRRWSFGREGRSHILKELLPFWAVCLLGWGWSSGSVHLMESYAKSHEFSHLTRTGSVVLVYVSAYGLLWVGRFFFFKKVLFARRQPDIAPTAQAAVDSGT